jgi:hypothetical protein
VAAVDTSLLKLLEWRDFLQAGKGEGGTGDPGCRMRDWYLRVSWSVPSVAAASGAAVEVEEEVVAVEDCRTISSARCCSASWWRSK